MFGIPKQIGDFQILDEVGRGSMATVHLAVNVATNESCCVKCIDKTTIENEEDTRHLEIEIGILRSLEHPNIVKYINFAQDMHYYYIFLEYVNGVNLLEYVNCNNGLNEPTTKKFSYQLFDTLKYLHERNIAHRDIKPENILIEESNNNIKLIDFGLSSITSKANVLSSTFCGSIHYTAPETLMHIPYVAPKADMWSVGIVIYAMFTDDLPWQSDNINVIARKIVNVDFELPASFPKFMANLILLLLQSDPDRRITAKEALDHIWFRDPRKGRSSMPTLSILENIQRAKKEGPIGRPMRKISRHMSTDSVMQPIRSFTPNRNNNPIPSITAIVKPATGRTMAAMQCKFRQRAQSFGDKANLPPIVDNHQPNYSSFNNTRPPKSILVGDVEEQ